MARPNNGPYIGDERNAAGMWQIRWTEDGRSKRRSTGTGNRAEANEVLAEFIIQKAHHDKQAAVPTVATILADYDAEHVESEVIAKDTQRTAMKHLAAHFGYMIVSELLPINVTDPVNKGGFTEKRRAGKIGRPASDGTIRRELGVLVAAVNHAIYHKRLKSADAPSVPLPPEPEANDRWLTHEEADALLAETAGRVHLFCEIALCTAQRKRAIETLTWFQVDFERRVIRFNPKGRRQTKKRRPVVPMNDHLFAVLSAAKAKRDQSSKRSDFVLGEPVNIRKALETACRRASLDDVTAHVLRHTWATWAAQRGVSLWKIAGVLGDTIETVTKRYLHHCPEHLRDAVQYDRPEKVDMESAAEPADMAGAHEA